MTSISIRFAAGAAAADGVDPHAGGDGDLRLLEAVQLAQDEQIRSVGRSWPSIRTSRVIDWCASGSALVELSGRKACPGTSTCPSRRRRRRFSCTPGSRRCPPRTIGSRSGCAASARPVRLQEGLLGEVVHVLVVGAQHLDEGPAHQRAKPTPRGKNGLVGLGDDPGRERGILRPLGRGQHGPLHVGLPLAGEAPVRMSPPLYG